MIKKPREGGGHSPRWAAEPEKIIINTIFTFLFYVYNIQLLNLNPVDNSDESLQDTLLIKTNLISRIPTIIINITKDAVEDKKIGA
jgi:hypothetical protein